MLPRALCRSQEIHSVPVVGGVGAPASCSSMTRELCYSFVVLFQIFQWMCDSQSVGNVRHGRLCHQHCAYLLLPGKAGSATALHEFLFLRVFHCTSVERGSCAIALRSQSWSSYNQFNFVGCRADVGACGETLSFFVVRCSALRMHEVCFRKQS